MSKEKKKATAKKTVAKSKTPEEVYETRSDKSSEKETATPALVCKDGRIAELVINPESGHVEFIVFHPKSGKRKRASKVIVSSKVFIPPTGAEQICTTGFGEISGAVLLPTEPVDYGSEEKLIREVRDFIHHFVELDENYEVIAAHYVLFTWLFDRFDEVAYLRFFASDIGVGKSRALEVVGAISYRPIFLAGASSCAALRRMVDSYKGTIVGDEQDCRGDQDLTSAYIKIFNQGFQRGRPVIICNNSGDDPKPQQFDVFGPKLVVTRTKFNDDALESRFFTIKMRQRTRNDLPLNLPRKKFDQQALNLRNKLLKYRFDNYHSVKLNPLLMVKGISDRLNQIGIPLLSTINNEDARARVISSLKAMHKELVEGWSNSIAGEAVRYLDERWAGSTGLVYVKDIAEHLNRLTSRGQSISIDLLGQPVCERKVGQIIRDQLGLKTRRTNKGYFVWKDMSRFAELKRKYDV